MKVLFITGPQQPFAYPQNQIRGGIEKVEQQQLAALEQLGFDVTVGLLADGKCNGFKTIRFPFFSAATEKKNQGSKVIRYIDDHWLHEDFDVILMNFVPSLGVGQGRAMSTTWWAHKLRIIAHDPPEYYMGFGGYGKIATQKWVVGQGGKLATVMANGNHFYDTYVSDLREGRNFAKLNKEINELFDLVPFDSSNFFYEVSLCADDFVPIDQLQDDNKIMFVGRPDNDVKGLSRAVKGVIESGQLDRFIGYSMTPTLPVEFKSSESIGEHWRYFELDRPHAEIMSALAKASIFLQPTASESAGGIVAFEAASHGVPVITSTDTGRRWLEPYGLYHYIEDRDPSTIAKKISEIKPLTLNERKDIARQVRKDFGFEAYCKQLEQFLSV